MDETTPLKWKDPDSGTDPETGKCLEERSKLDRLFLIVALIGVFLAYTDETFVLSIHGEIASEFNSLPLGPWLITGYTLGFVITLPLYGRVCELYGYKVPLMIAYTMFAGGCVLT
ncbi:transporter [Penicillium longicatenatum]|nr:transporter [Penicillium longicatenatum]